MKYIIELEMEERKEGGRFPYNRIKSVSFYSSHLARDKNEEEIHSVKGIEKEEMEKQFSTSWHLELNQNSVVDIATYYS